MELTVSNPNLHPVWAKVLGFPPTTLPDSPPEPATTSASTADASDGWQVVSSANPHPGAPVAIRKSLGPHLWMSTTVIPGDPRYPGAHQV